MTEDVAASFATVIETGEVLTIKYHGGSSPGAVRELTPVKVEDDRVRARCHTSNAVKVFMLDKIELLPKTIDQVDVSKVWDGRPTDDSEIYAAPTNAGGICTDRLEAFRELGWQVVTHDDPDHFSLCLHRPKKTGTGWLKNPSAGLAFERYAWDAVATPDGGFEKANVRLRPRPWVVWGKDTTVSFGSYNKAVSKFLSQVSDGPF